MGGGMPGGGGGQQVQQLMNSGGSIKAEFKGPKPPAPSPQEAAYNAAQGGGGAQSQPGPGAPPTPMNPQAIMSQLQAYGMAPRPAPMYGGPGGLTPRGLPGATPTL